MATTKGDPDLVPITELDKQKKKAPKGGKKVSALDAAAQVLAAASGPMNTTEMIAEMATQGLWSSPGGKTPAATLYSAIIREIKLKGGEARFRKVERGKFVHAG
jgi:hypothetical protein